ncbi:hypothetical protein [Streptomyces sp. NPDC052107]|uniref:hypothetical protein n=1 Tax=Streptomyces sp. NPDC052107 TaxID=3155632 RepID=UPI0034467EF7
MSTYNGPLANASMAFGSVTAPTAGAAIATSLPPGGKGLFQIDVVAYLSGSGTPAAADNKNIEFRFGATTLASVPLVPANNVPTVWRTYFTSDGTTNFSVNATGAATASVIYNVSLVATRLTSAV